MPEVALERPQRRSMAETHINTFVENPGMGRNLKWAWFRSKHDLRRFLGRKKAAYHEMTCYEKFIFIIEIPFTILRDLSVPVANEGDYTKWLVTIQPITAPFFLIVTLGEQSTEIFGFNILVYQLSLGLILAICVHFTTSHHQLPSYDLLYALAGMCQSVLWIYLLSNILMDLLTFISIITELDSVLIGFTLLAWGNSLGDFVADQALAKAGYGVMAVTGCFAGQLFNLLIGFGVICFRQTLATGDIKFDLFSDINANILAIVIIFYHQFNLIQNLIYLCCGKWKIKSPFWQYVMFFYVSFILVAAGIVIYQQTN